MVRTSFFVQGKRVWEVESDAVMQWERIEEIINFCNAAEIGDVDGIFLEVGVLSCGGIQAAEAVRGADESKESGSDQRH